MLGHVRFVKTLKREKERRRAKLETQECVRDEEAFLCTRTNIFELDESCRELHCHSH